jgi:uncharacterized protein
MTPQERQLVDDLFDRLAKVEGTPRDPDALAAIAQGLRSAPNAVYALVQTVLLQDEALKRANSRIQELEAGGAGEQPQSGGFLDSMRETIFGQSPPRGSVPNVPKPDMAGRPVWNTGQALQQAQSPGQYGGVATINPMADRSLRWAAARCSAAVAVRFSAPQRRPRPEWSADRYCSAASAR